MIPSQGKQTIESLSKKVNKLEALVIALIASNDNFEDYDIDELFHLFRRKDYDKKDKELYYFLRNIKHKKNNGDARIDNIQDAKQYFIRELTKIEKNQKTISFELHHYLSYQFLGTDLNNIKLHRFIPIRIYLTDDNTNDIDNITNAITVLLNRFDFEFSDDFPAEKGSWWKKWFAKSKDTITQPEVKDRLAKLERAIENKGLHKPQSEINKNQAEAIATLTNAIKDIDSVAIQAGSILLVKTTNNTTNSTSLQVKLLSTRDLIYIENNQHILREPDKTLELLSDNSEIVGIEN